MSNLDISKWTVEDVTSMLMAESEKFEVWCKHCNDWRYAYTMCGHYYCFKCKELLGFGSIAGYKVPMTWEGVEFPPDYAGLFDSRPSPPPKPVPIRYLGEKK